MQDLDLSPMDGSSVSRLSYRRSKPLGKVRRRVQELRTPSSYNDLIASRSTLDLSHNEAARLAADSLLSRGLEEYHQVLNAEGEVDFLSEPDKSYILENGRDGSTAHPDASDDADKESESFSDDSQTTTKCPVMSTDSDHTVTGLDLSGLKDVKTTNHVSNEYKLYFQSDSRPASMKDLIRGYIRKAEMSLAIVIDCFSDVELLCDLLEASRKRNVSVYLLLDQLNLDLFVSMWQDLKLDSKSFPKLSVRSVGGQTYCAKTGRKLTGQIAESFFIIDWTEVLTGSYSFSWLTWQVHRSMAIFVKGNGVALFKQEFQRLYSSSKPVSDFVNYISLPCAHPLHTALHSAQDGNTAVSGSTASQIKTQHHRDLTEEAQNTETKPNMPVLSEIQRLELECSKSEPLHRANTGTQVQEKPPPLGPNPPVQPLQTAAVMEPKEMVGAVCTLHDAQTHVEALEKNPDQIKTPISQVQSLLNRLTVTEAERKARAQESQPLHTAHGQHRPARYHSTLNTMLNLKHNVGTEGLLFQQRSRDRMATPSGGVFAGLRRQWNCSLYFKPNVDFASELSPSTLQQEQANTALRFPLSHPGGQRSGIQMSSQASRRHDQPQRHQQPPLLPHPNTHTPASMGSQLNPQLQSDSKLFSQLRPQPLSSQQVNPPPRLNWMPQSHAAGPRLVARQSSFNATYSMGQNTDAQAGWRSFTSSMNPALGRSKSMNERHSAGFKGAGRNPNISTTWQ